MHLSIHPSTRMNVRLIVRVVAPFFQSFVLAIDQDVALEYVLVRCSTRVL